MPIINVTMGHTDESTKQQLIEKLTDAASKITEIPSEKFITVIEEYDSKNIGIGGKSLADIMAAAKT